MDKNGSLSGVAGSMVEAALHINPDLKETDLLGEAVGERFLLEFAVEAAKRGVRINNIFGVDPLGFEARRLTAILSGKFLYNAQASRMKRNHGSWSDSAKAGDNVLGSNEKSFEKLYAEVAPVKEVSRIEHVKMLARQTAVVKMLLKKSAVSMPTGFDALQAALDAHPEMLTSFVFGGKSAVGRPTAEVRDKLKKISQKNNNRVYSTVWPYDNQDIGLARNHPRHIAYQKDFIRATTK